MTARRRRQPRLTAEPSFGKAYFLSLNLPKDLAASGGLLSWIGADPETAGTPLDVALAPGVNEWTAPSGADAGDVAFFHYAARAKAYVASHRRAAERAGILSAGLADFLDHAARQAAEYAGCVFGYARVLAPACYYQPDPERSSHWASRQMALMGPVIPLRVPLLLRDHADVLPQPHSTITSLTSREFAVLKQRLSEVGNGVLPLLDSVIPGRDDADRVTTETWRTIGCGPELQFSDEQQLRGAFVDHLLEAIKDPGTVLHREVWCRLKGHRGIPRVDYLVALAGHWTPVEVKLNANAWPNLMIEQVPSYLGVDAYEVGVTGGKREQIVPPRMRSTAQVALIIDKRGLYAVKGGAFSECALDRPLLTREAVGRASSAEIRRTLLAALHGVCPAHA